MKTISLNGPWRMRKAGAARFYDVTVPTTVCTDLLANGLLEDPYYRDNEDAALLALRSDYEYSRTFTVPEDFLDADSVELVCHGIDTIADIHLNGALLFRADNMHRTWRTGVKAALHPGENAIRVCFHSAAEYAERLERENPVYKTSDTVDGFEQVRKAHCMYGWDWGPKLPDMGIFRSIELRAASVARFADVGVRQTHGENAVDIAVETELERLGRASGSHTVHASLTGPDGRSWQECAVCSGGGQALAFHVDAPQLWWPNGYGEHPLYALHVELSGTDGAVLDTRDLNIGLRTLTVKTDPDEWGSKFEFCVNGVSIFAMGANYIPEDSILTRITPQRTEQLLRQCVRANYNTIRVWGGGYFQDDSFYDCCDRLGLLVWQDLLFACAVYELTDSFAQSIVAETQDNVRRLRHHASIALWCGNNELEWGWSGWDMGFGNDPHRRADYIKQFEWLLPQAVKAVDPDRFYWVASPSSGGGFDDPNDQNRGDVHYWEVWHRLKPFTEYRKYHFRFCSEFGFQSFPSPKTIGAFTLPEDRNVFSDVMECHQKNGTANGRILMYLADNFLYPTRFETLVYASQVLQAEAIRYGVEHWRANRGRCMGSLYWQVNDCWPVASWSSLDYYNRWKPLHYYAKNFYAPLLCSAADAQGLVSLRVCSEQLRVQKCTVYWQLRGAQDAVLLEGQQTVDAQPLSVTPAGTVDCASWLTEKAQRQTVYLCYWMETEAGCTPVSVLLFCKPKHFRFAAPELSLSVQEQEDAFILTLAAEHMAKYVWLDSPDFDFILSDNCLDIVPGRPAVLILKKSDISRAVQADELKHLDTLCAYDIR